MAYRNSARHLVMILGLAVAASVIVACSGNSETNDSEEVTTRSIWAGMDFEAKGNGTTGVKVELNVGSFDGPNVRLSGIERLEVDASGLIVALSEDVDFADVDYEASVPTDASNTLFRIAFHRADGTINSRSSVILPATFIIIAPVTGQTLSASNGIAVSWSPSGSGSDINLDVTTRCTLTNGNPQVAVDFLQVRDNGQATINQRQLGGVSNPDVDRSKNCDISIVLRRERTGSLDPSFRAGGFVRAAQERSVDEMLLTL